MSRVEFMQWMEFYAAHPFDDRSRYHVPAAMVAAVGPGGNETSPKFDKLMEFLDNKPAEVPPEYEGFSAADISILRELGGTPPKRKG